MLAAEEQPPKEKPRILRENVERLKQQIAEREWASKPSSIPSQTPKNLPQPPQTPQATQAQKKKLLPRPTQTELQQAEKAVLAALAEALGFYASKSGD